MMHTQELVVLVQEFNQIKADVKGRKLTSLFLGLIREELNELFFKYSLSMDFNLIVIKPDMLLIDPLDHMTQLVLLALETYKPPEYIQMEITLIE